MLGSTQGLDEISLHLPALADFQSSVDSAVPLQQSKTNKRKWLFSLSPTACWWNFYLEIIAVELLQAKLYHPDLSYDTCMHKS